MQYLKCQGDSLTLMGARLINSFFIDFVFGFWLVVRFSMDSALFIF
jgi:hypothetical protein